MAREHTVDPIATARHAKAVAEGNQGNEKAALVSMGVGDAVLLC